MPWTAGDIATALAKLRRMLDGGGRHPLVVMATARPLCPHAAARRGAGQRRAGRGAATRAPGLDLPGPQGDAAGLARLGHDRIVDAISLLAAADLDLRGAKAWPEDPCSRCWWPAWRDWR